MLKELVYEDKFIASSVGQNLIDGAWWGFCSNEDYEKLVREQGNVGNNGLTAYYKLKGNSGVLIDIDPSYGFDLLKNIDNLDLDYGDIEDANSLNMAGLLAFRLFLKNNDEYHGFIGVNEITDSISVSVSQMVYPSFKVDFKGVMHEFDRMNVEYLNESNQWVKYRRGISKEDFIKSFTMSPTRNCMVLPIKIAQGMG